MGAQKKSRGRDGVPPFPLGGNWGGGLYPKRVGFPLPRNTALFLYGRWFEKGLLKELGCPQPPPPPLGLKGGPMTPPSHYPAFPKNLREVRRLVKCGRGGGLVTGVQLMSGTEATLFNRA